MRTTHRTATRWAILLASATTAWACADAPTAPSVAPPRQEAVKFWDDLATVRWNKRATNLLEQYGAPSNGQAWASRMLTYLSLAQYHAILDATAPEGRRARVRGRRRGPRLGGRADGFLQGLQVRRYPTRDTVRPNGRGLETRLEFATRGRS